MVTYTGWQVMYDPEWVSNVFSYTMPELTNASYADSWYAC